MNNIRETLKEAFKPRQRNAFSAILIVLILMAVSIAGVLVATGTFFDLADTTSIVDAIDITGQTIYSDQGFVSVQVKNNGNTAIDGVHATLLVATANTGAGTGTAVDCGAGSNPLAISSSATSVARYALDPGESVTISGGLTYVATAPTTGGVTALTGTGNSLLCDGDTNEGKISDRTKYILQINGFSGEDIISKTIQVRAR